MQCIEWQKLDRRVTINRAQPDLHLPRGRCTTQSRDQWSRCPSNGEQHSRTMAISTTAASAVFVAYIVGILGLFVLVIISVLPKTDKVRLFEQRPFLFLRCAVGALLSTWYCECIARVKGSSCSCRSHDPVYAGESIYTHVNFHKATANASSGPTVITPSCTARHLSAAGSRGPRSLSRLGVKSALGVRTGGGAATSARSPSSLPPSSGQRVSSRQLTLCDVGDC